MYVHISCVRLKIYNIKGAFLRPFYPLWSHLAPFSYISVCVCMCVCIDICIYTYISIYIHIYIYTYIYRCTTCVNTYMYMYIYKYAPEAALPGCTSK